MTLRRVLREPLLHFLLLGLALFLVHGLVAPGAGGDRRIVVTPEQVSALSAEHARQWGRPPSDGELAGFVESWVRDEILYREGVALGLDRDDAVVKRRVRQKLEVLAEEEIARGAPSDAELSAYLGSNPERFTRPPVLTFEQILLDPATAGRDTARAVAAVRAALARGAAPAELGRATLLPGRVDDAPLDVVARDFGEAFAARLERVAPDEWTGPVASGFGVHLVRVVARTPGAVPPLDAVRGDVAREWESARRERALAESYRRLRRAYDVDVPATLPRVGEPRS